MKKTIALINTVLLSFLFSVDTYTVIQDSSRLEWIGSKVTGSHDGVIDFKSGTVMIKDKKLQSAELVVDMKSITCLDIKKKSSNEYFVDHLKSDDFFGVKKFPEAKIKFLSTEIDKETGETMLNCELTIKEITNKVKFPVTITFDKNLATAEGTLIVDRTKYGIKYKSKTIFSDIGDRFIYDDFTLTFKIVSELNK